MTIRAESSQRRLSWTAGQDQSGRNDKGPSQNAEHHREKHGWRGKPLLTIRLVNHNYYSIPLNVIIDFPVIG